MDIFKKAFEATLGYVWNALKAMPEYKYFEKAMEAWEAAPEYQAYEKACKAVDETKEALKKAEKAEDEAANAYWKAEEAYISTPEYTAYEEAKKAVDETKEALKKAEKAEDEAWEAAEGTPAYKDLEKAWWLANAALEYTVYEEGRKQERPIRKHMRPKRHWRD